MNGDEETDTTRRTGTDGKAYGVGSAETARTTDTTPAQDTYDAAGTDERAYGGESAGTAQATDITPAQDTKGAAEQRAEGKSAAAAKRAGRIATTVVVVILCVLMLPILAVNLTLIIRGSLNPEELPSVFGIAPLAVTSGSMSGENEDSFDVGALIFVKLLDGDGKQSLETGDVVCYRTGEIYVTHRIVSVNAENGQIKTVVTKGDANNAADDAVPISDVVGICIGSVSGLGSFAMYLQTAPGILVFVGVPVLLFILYDVVRITLYNRRARADAKTNSEAASENALREKEEEIRRLRALLGETGAGENENSPADE